MLPKHKNIHLLIGAHKGQAKKLLRGQIIIAKVTLERAPCFIITLLYFHFFLSLYSDDSFFPTSELQKAKINPYESITRLWETADMSYNQLISSSILIIPLDGKPSRGNRRAIIQSVDYFCPIMSPMWHLTQKKIPMSPCRIKQSRAPIMCMSRSQLRHIRVRPLSDSDQAQPW